MAKDLNKNVLEELNKKVDVKSNDKEPKKESENVINFEAYTDDQLMDKFNKFNEF